MVQTVPVDVADVLAGRDPKSTRLKSQPEIYTLSLHDALPISGRTVMKAIARDRQIQARLRHGANCPGGRGGRTRRPRSEKHTAEIPARDLHSFPTRRSSDLREDGHEGDRERSTNSGSATSWCKLSRWTWRTYSPA